MSIVEVKNPAHAESGNMNETIGEEVSYVDKNTGDTITIKEVDGYQGVGKVVSEISYDSADEYVTQIYKNGELEETLIIDWANDRLTHVHSNGQTYLERISDVVEVIAQENVADDAGVDIEGNQSVAYATNTDYIDNEPFALDEDGYQIPIDGTYIYNGYRAMGHRGGCYYEPDAQGYLQRYDDGVNGVYYSNLFEFSAGTVIGTAASLIVSYYTGVGWELTLAVVVSCLGAIIDTVLYDWETVFEIRVYQWNYDVRLNSDYGEIIYETYRTKDYVKAYEPNTGKKYFEYRGSGYDGGFLLSNYELIKYALDNYYGG